MMNHLPKHLRWAAICAGCAAFCFYCLSGGRSLDERVAHIVTNWRKTDAVVLLTKTRTITTKYRTEQVYPTTVGFRHSGTSEVAEVELVFEGPKRVGEIVEVYYDPSKAFYTRDDVESVEGVSIALSATRSAVSQAFFAFGIVSLLAAGASIVFYFRARQAQTAPSDTSKAPATSIASPSTPTLSVNETVAKLRSADRAERIEALDSIDGQTDLEMVKEELVRVITTDPSESVRESASRAMVRLAGGNQTISLLLKTVLESDPHHRQMTVATLGCMGSSIRGRVMVLLDHPDPAVRNAALEILRRFEMWGSATEP